MFNFVAPHIWNSPPRLSVTLSDKHTQTYGDWPLHQVVAEPPDQALGHSVDPGGEDGLRHVEGALIGSFLQCGLQELQTQLFKIEEILSQHQFNGKSPDYFQDISTFSFWHFAGNNSWILMKNKA